MGTALQTALLTALLTVVWNFGRFLCFRFLKFKGEQLELEEI